MHGKQSLVLLLNCSPELEPMCSRELKADDSGHSFAEHCRPDSSTEPERLQTTASFFRERQCSLKPKLNGSLHNVLIWDLFSLRMLLLCLGESPSSGLKGPVRMQTARLSRNGTCGNADGLYTVKYIVFARWTGRF